MGKQVAARLKNRILNIFQMGVELSWESTCLASRGSRVRISPSPFGQKHKTVYLIRKLLELPNMTALQ